MCPARRTVNVKSICPASVNHVSYRVRSRGFSLAGRPLQAAQIETQTFLDSLSRRYFPFPFFINIGLSVCVQKVHSGEFFFATLWRKPTI